MARRWRAWEDFSSELSGGLVTPKDKGSHVGCPLLVLFASSASTFLSSTRQATQRDGVCSRRQPDGGAHCAFNPAEPSNAPRACSWAF